MNRQSPGKDEVFKDHDKDIEDFQFGDKVVQVFDDMVGRSVPFYHEIQRMIGEMAADFAEEGSSVYDLGCSTGTTLMTLDKVIAPSIRFVGIDNSEEMVKQCRENFKKAGMTRPNDIQYGDLNKGVLIENASVVVMCLTLQFVRPLHRERVISEIYRQLNENGCFIIVEKVLGEDSLLNRLFIKYYYDMKRRHHYSDLEISQKREALENVLIPYRLTENMELLAKSGFRYSEVFFKWYNFAGMIAVK